MVTNPLPGGTYAVAAFDISNDDDRSSVWDELRGKVLRATKSCMIFDLAFQPDVDRVLRKYATGPNDSIFPPNGPLDAEKTKQWVRAAFEQFVNDQVRLIRQTISKAEALVREKKLGVIDFTDRHSDSLKRIEQRVEDLFVAAATFRMDGEFQSFKEALSKRLDLEGETVANLVVEFNDQFRAEAKEVRASKESEAGT